MPFPHTRESSVDRWSNFHGTIRDRTVPLLLVPDLPGAIDSAAPRLRRSGEALSAIVAYALQAKKTLRVQGSRWSLSDVIGTGAILLDSAYLNAIMPVRNAWLTEGYVSTRSSSGFVPVFAQGGTTIHDLHKVLGELGLALRTSGAADGQRIAGAIATGTHGSAIDFGAMHDAVLGVHLVVAGDKALFVMPRSNPAMTTDLGDWLGSETGIPTETIRDDDAFAAAQVSLGSLGVVHGVVIEAEPLYGLRRQVIPFDSRDIALGGAVQTLDTLPLHPHRPKRPFHFEVVLSPYPQAGSGAFAVLMWKEDLAAAPIAPPPADPELSLELFGFIGLLAGLINDSWGGQAIEALVNALLAGRFVARDDDPRSPGEVFGPTTLPPGNGTSTEIAVAHEHALSALDVIHGAIAAEAAEGRQHLGVLGVRFVPRGTGALLGMNKSSMTMHVEIGGIQTIEAMHIFDRCWQGLDLAQIPFACHWGQQGGHTRERVRHYFGASANRWRAARRAMLTAAARQVFASPMLSLAGLD